MFLLYIQSIPTFLKAKNSTKFFFVICEDPVIRHPVQHSSVQKNFCFSKWKTKGRNSNISFIVLESCTHFAIQLLSYLWTMF